MFSRLRLSPTRYLWLMLVILVATGLTLGSAACSPDPSMLSFRDAVAKMTGLRFEGPDPVEVTDERALQLFKEYLLKAEEVLSPSENARSSTPMSMRFGEQWEIRPHESCYGRLATGSPLYVKWKEKWYAAPGEIVSMVKATGRYRPASYVVDSADVEFLKPYGWTPFFPVSSMNADLPASFVHEPGDYPEVIYWAWNNELSKDIGLDLSLCLGTTVEARVYKVVELLPEELGVNRGEGRAVVLRSEGRMVGAWLDLGRHYSFACSLNGRTRLEATGKSLDDWVTCLIDPSNPVEQRLSKMSPEQVIETYYSAIDRKDYKTAHACESRNYLISYLAINMDDNRLFNDGFGDEVGKGLGNFVSVKLLKVTRQEQFEREEAGYGDVRCYSVALEQERRVAAGSPGGYFMTMKQETPLTGWRIYSIGTGP